MGTVHEVSVTYSRTVNLGNYESERLEVGQVAMVGQDEAPETEIRELYTECKAIVQARLKDAADLRAEARRRERQRRWDEGPPRAKVDEQDGEDDDPEPS